MRRRYKILLALLVIIGAPYYWLLLDNRPGNAPGPRLDIAELRRLADAVPGPKPYSVAIQSVGWRRLPGTFLVAAGGLKRRLISIQAMQISGAWGNVVVDSGFGARDARDFGLERYFPERQARIDAAMRNARLILFTHEHVDHMGGLLRLPDFAAVAPKARITPEQLGGNRWSDSLPWPQGRERLQPLRYRGMIAVAPGVVLIRTPGHTPGSQMVFVRLRDGREYLLAGDTATMTRNWRLLRARSRLVGDLMGGEDRAAVFGWLKAIRALKQADPALVVVPGHEYEALYWSKQDAPKLVFRFPRPSPPPR